MLFGRIQVALFASPALRVRYGALKTLGEKKAAFNEWVQQRKREEAEEARQRRMQVGRAARARLVARALLVVQGWGVQRQQASPLPPAVLPCSPCLACA